MQHCNKSILSANLIIRKLLAGFLLVVFAFGITPKRSLHNLLANHKDGRPGAIKSGVPGSQLGKAAFNCQCDNLISESPFVNNAATETAEIVKLFPVLLPGLVSQPVSSAPTSYALRGPPAC